MTNYQSGVAFRRALEDRLASQSAKTQTPLVRLRKLVAFDRFLARLVQIEPDTWLLKGGLVLQLTQHLAEKVHAYIRPRAAGESTRVKDLVDILLIAEHMTINGPVLRNAIQATFTAQGMGDLPPKLSAPPPAWALTFRKLAEEVGLSCATLSEADQAARRFIDPVLGGTTQGNWSPERQSWD